MPDSYQGERDEEGRYHCPNGKAILIKDIPIMGKVVYEGPFDKGERSGYGVLKTGEWNIYEGHFENDERHGYGKLSVNIYGIDSISEVPLPTFGAYEAVNSYVYEGYWEKGKYHGKGKLIFGRPEIDGDKHFIYEGNFRNYKMHGIGKFTQKGLTYTGMCPYKLDFRSPIQVKPFLFTFKMDS